VLPRRLIIAIAILITVVWAVSFVADAVNKTYEPPPSVHPLMLMVAGAAFGSEMLRTRNGKNGS